MRFWGACGCGAGPACMSRVTCTKPTHACSLIYFCTHQPKAGPRAAVAGSATTWQRGLAPRALHPDAAAGRLLLPHGDDTPSALLRADCLAVAICDVVQAPSVHHPRSIFRQQAAAQRRPVGSNRRLRHMRQRRALRGRSHSSRVRRCPCCRRRRPGLSCCRLPTRADLGAQMACQFLGGPLL